MIPVACVVAAGLIATGGFSPSAQTLSLQLKASNYNPTTGVWTDSSGNSDNATYYGSLPTLVSGLTPNGSSAVGLNLGHTTGIGFTLASSLSGANGYTVFALIEPTTDTGGSRFALTGGSSSSALEYNLYQGHQNWLNEYQGGGGAGTGTISTSSFSLIDLAVTSSGGSFNLNGSSDGTTSPGFGAFTSPITRIGNNEGGGDGFAGYIAEIDIYEGVLSSAQISSVESAFTAEYITSVPEPSTWAMMAGGFGMLFAARRFRRAQA